VRELDRGLAVALAGLALYVAADLSTLHSVVQPGGAWPWQGAALACVGWPLICAGLLLISASPPDLPAADVPRAESRRLATVTAVVLVLLAGYLATLVGAGDLDGVTLALPAVVVVAFAGRELVAARQSSALMENLLLQARSDALTGLPNRWELAERLRALATGEQDVCVLTLDLDGFKDVNGLLGHATGDLLLARVGQRLTAACREDATAYRLGGDEFAVLAPVDADRAAALAEVLREEVRRAAADVPGVVRVPLSASVGVAVAQAGEGSPGAAASQAMSRSALALRLAKTAGRDRVQTYSEEIAREGLRRSAVERALRRAVAERSVEVHLQPVVELATERLAGFEALARWTDPELGSVPPAEFVAVAEGSGLVTELGDLVLQRAVEAALACDCVAAGVNVAVNVSAPQLRVPGFASRVAGALQAAGIPPHRLVLELTEGAFVSERDPAVRTLHELVELGVPVAVDDFGTGYSALGYLDRLPVQIVKIDRSLTARFDEPRTVSVARAVVELGRGLGLDVVVEGIETPAQDRVARRLGAQYGQGWLWSPAVPVAEAPDVMARLAAAASREA
jgi:diguanylate cyclase (GGDEF)-like protein